MKSRKFEITLTLQTNWPVTPEDVQNAMLRAIATKAFGIPGSCQINVRPLEVVSAEEVEAVETIARPGICPCRGCETPLLRKHFVCGAHFRVLPKLLQAALRAASNINRGDIPIVKETLAGVLLACVGFVARSESKGNTRDELGAMALFEPAATQAGTA
jgi:hypothetical protein